MYEHIKICIFIILYYQNAISYKIYQLDSAEGNKLLPKIRQLLLNQRNDEPEYQSVQVKQAKREPPPFKPMGKSVLVKRVIPHDYVTGPYEYDSKLNTVFKPLIRYRFQKPIEVNERSLLKSMESDQKQKDQLGKDLIILVPKDGNQIDVLNQIQKYINRNVRQKDNKKTDKDKYIILDTIDKGSVTSLRQKSGEDNDPFAPGKMPPEFIESPSSESIEEPSNASYPFWNYWTYSKTFPQDPCPNNLMNIGNMCVSSLGHRRSAGPPDTRRSHHHKKISRSIRASRKKHLYGRRKLI